MSEKKTGIVTEIYEGTTKSGKPYKAFTLNAGDKVTAFEEQLSYVEGVKAGEKVTFEVEKKGQYINVVGESAVDVKYIATPEEKVNPERLAKNRISSLAASVDYIVGALGGTATTKDVVKTAQTFYDYISTGEYTGE